MRAAAFAVALAWITTLGACMGDTRRPSSEDAPGPSRANRDTVWRAEDARREVTMRARLAALTPEDARAYASAAAATARAESLGLAGDTEAAMNLIERQRAILSRLLGPDHAETASSTSALARVAFAQGEFERAHELDREALAARRHELGDRHPDVAESLTQLASDVKNSGGSWNEAMQLNRAALTLRRELFGWRSPEVTESLMAIGNLYRLRNLPDSARATFHEVLEIRRGTKPHDPDAIASTLTALSLVYTQASQWSAAEPLLREAVALRRGMARTPLSGLELSLSTYGMTLRHVGRNAQAESVLTECAALRETLRRGARRGVGRAAMFELAVYWQLAAAQLEQGKQDDAWLSLERATSRTLIEALSDRGVIDTLGMWRGALARVQRTIAPDAALIGWLELKRGAGREGYPFWCYAIRHEGPVRWHRVDGPPGDMWTGSTDAVYRMKQEMRAAADWPLRVTDVTAATRLATDLYRLRLAPLEPDLVGVRRLIVVSPDIMRGVPLEALTDTAGHALVDRFEISYTPSALLGALRRERAGPRPRARAWHALLVGDPAFRDPAHVASASATTMTVAGAASTTSVGGWPRLAASSDEIRDAAELLPRARVLLGAAASEANLRRLAAAGALQKFELLHFATHAVVDERWPGRSALILAESAGPTVEAAGGPDRESSGAEPSGSLDGRVTADEITSGWTLDARLVSLAACRTVIGPVSQVEGYLGLEQALLGSGAHRLLMSLWHVDDRATALLMQRFYRNLVEGEPEADAPAAALREAQRWLRDWRAPDGGQPYRHPVYWSGIILIGDSG